MKIKKFNELRSFKGEPPAAKKWAISSDSGPISVRFREFCDSFGKEEAKKLLSKLAEIAELKINFED